MGYNVEHRSSRTVFVFRDCLKTFEEFWEIIDKTIKPDHKSEIEITSWTEGMIFTKDGMKIYFEYFYESPSYYSFELFPLGNNDEYEINKLRILLDDIKEAI